LIATKILWGQIVVVFATVLATLWAATQWTAWRLGFQPQLFWHVAAQCQSGVMSAAGGRRSYGCWPKFMTCVSRGGFEQVVDHRAVQTGGKAVRRD
jgi:hypothetical protein